MTDLIFETVGRAILEALGVYRFLKSKAFALIALVIVVQALADGVLAWALTCPISLLGLALFKRSRPTAQLNGVIYLLVAQVQIALIYGILLFTYGHPTLSLIGTPAWILTAVGIALWVPAAVVVNREPTEVDHA